MYVRRTGVGNEIRLWEESGIRGELDRSYSIVFLSVG
jgi:hypothetical protein